MIPERPRPKFIPLRETETGHTPERPTSLALLNAAKNLMTAAGLQKEFETGEFFNFVLEKPDGTPLLLISSLNRIHPHGTEKQHLYVGPVVGIYEGSHVEHGGIITSPDVTFTETGQILEVEQRPGRRFHAYSLNWEDPESIGKLRTHITPEERQFAEDIALSVAQRLSSPEWMEAAAAYKAEQITNKPFPILSISRALLKEEGFSEAEIESLTDSDMQHIAERMGDAYRENGLSEDLQIHTRNTLDFGSEMT